MSIATALENLDTVENDYANAVLAHDTLRTVVSRQAVTDAVDAFIAARQTVRDLAGAPLYRS